MGETIATVATAIVGVAMVAVLVQSPYTAAVFTAGGNAFAGAVSAAQGQIGRR